MNDFLATKAINSRRTMETYMWYLRSYFRWKGDTGIDMHSYSNYLLHLRRMNRRQNGIATASTVLREYARFKHINTDEWPVPRKQEVPTRPLKENEIMALREAILNGDNPWRNIFIFDFLLGTGMRVDELLKLKWSDLDLEPVQNGKYLDPEAGVRATCVIAVAKGNKSRTIPLTATAAEAAWNYARYVFGDGITARKLRLKKERVLDLTTRMAINYILSTAADRAGLASLGVHPHLLRHTFATSMASSGLMAVHELKPYLGHSSIQTTERYMHFSSMATEKRIATARLFHLPPEKKSRGAPEPLKETHK